MREEPVDYQIVTLQRARQATDLWPAIEAAQYGHVVQRDDEDDSDGAGPVGEFVDAFSDIVEAWEGAAPEVQGALIRTLDARFAALHETGCGVHWGTVHHGVATADGETVEIPIAVLHLGPHDEAEMEVALPANLAADEDDEPDPA